MSDYEQWKDEFCEREDAEALRHEPAPAAVWRAFAGPDGEPLDIRVRWFSEVEDDVRLKATVSERLRSQIRNWYFPDPPSAAFIQIVVADDVAEAEHRRTVRYAAGAVTMCGPAPDAPPGSPHEDATELRMRALAQFAGEEGEQHLPRATYVAAVTFDLGVEGNLTLFDETLDMEKVRHAFGARLAQVAPYLLGKWAAVAICLSLFPDGAMPCQALKWVPMPERRTGEAPEDPDRGQPLPWDELLAGALADLQVGQTP